MGLEVVVSEIMEQGRRRADALISEARAEADRQMKEATAKTVERAEAIVRDGERQADALRVQGEARAEFEAKKQVLFAERSLWDELRSAVLTALREAEPAKRKAHLDALVSQAKTQVPQGTAIVRDEDVPYVEGYEAKGGLKGVGGAIVESTDGTVRLDLTYETLLDDVWKDVLRQEAKQLMRKE